ncbi:hypothetical protein [Ferrovibrio sp.]|uniref:hypothetical protein n=1 Tax=Ferrovibrio sp. TaxID=1917215 RepID=UPI002632C935|nr:hypothetical protein [Ferrovibrio sp.]
MKIMHLAAALGMSVAISGCVSVFEGTSQDISVGTNPAGATCSFIREGQSIGTVQTPGILTVRKSKHDITIKCNKDGYHEASYLNNSGVSGTIAANVVVDILLTAGISSIVDSANGADNKYDSAVNLTLIPINGAKEVAKTGS